MRILDMGDDAGMSLHDLERFIGHARALGANMDAPLTASVDGSSGDPGRGRLHAISALLLPRKASE